MVTTLYSLEYVHGAGILFFFWLICALIYLALCFISKRNRSDEGRKTVFYGLLGAEIFIDVLWSFYYYPGGEYVNMGLGAVFGILLWIPVLVVAGIAVTVRNVNR